MTDTNPNPGTTAAVDPDGYPAHVVSGELVESSWGNAVSDTLRGHQDAIYDHTYDEVGGVVVLVTNGAGDVGPITFSRPFAPGVTPVVNAFNADPTNGPAWWVQGVWGATNTVFYVRCITAAGPVVGGSVRIAFVAHASWV